MSVGFPMVLLATCSHRSPSFALYCLEPIVILLQLLLIAYHNAFQPVKGNLLVCYPRFPPLRTGYYLPMATSSLGLQRLPRGQAHYFLF